MAGGALDEVELEDFSDLREEILQVVLANMSGQIAHKDGATITLAGSQEGLIAGVAGGSAVLLEVKGSDRVDRVTAESLRGEVREGSRSDRHVTARQACWGKL